MLSTSEMSSELKKLVFAIRQGDLNKVTDLIGNNPLPEGGCSLLCTAIEHKQSAIAKLLIRKNASVNDTQKSQMFKDTPLHLAVMNRDIEIVRILIDSGADVNAKDSHGLTALHQAIEDRHKDIVQILLEHGADMNLNTESGVTSHHFVVLEGIKKIFWFLDRNEPDVNVTNRSRLTALYLTIKKRCKDIVRILLEYCANVNLKTVSSVPLLHLAVEKGDEEICKLLIEKGADINAGNKNGLTALHLAIEKRHKDIVQILLKHDADVNLTAIDEPPLHTAVEKGEEEICKLLIEKGADVNAENKNGLTALHLAIEKRHQEIVKVLLKHDADVNLTAIDEPPLHTAVEKGEEEICKLLIEKGADINAENKNGLTALHLAIEKSHKDIVQILLKHDADVNLTAIDEPPLHTAVKKSEEEICKLLIERGADVKAKDRNGLTALHLAAEEEQVHIMEILLTSGVDIDSVCDNSDTALHLLCKDIQKNVLSSMRPVEPSPFHFVNIFRNEVIPPVDHIDPDVEFDVHPMFTIIQKHLIKIQIANLEVNNGSLQNLRIAADISGQSHHKEKCKEEVKRMKSTEINRTNITFHDIVTKPMDRIVLYVRNENVAQALKLDNYQREFPEYAGMIESRLNKGRIRKELLDEGDQFFRGCFRSYYLPYNCTEEILSYLSNTDLTILKNVCRNVRSNTKDIPKQRTL